MSSRPDQDWAALGSAWRAQDADMELSEDELKARLHRQQVLLALAALAEALSLLLILGIAVWLSSYWLAEPGASPILVILLMVPTVAIVWQRRRRQAAPEPAGLQWIDATIEREERRLESIRLGSVMSQLALTGMIMMVLVHLYHHSLVFTPASIACFALMCLYVFGLQIVLIVWHLRVRGRRRRLEAIRRELQPLE
jgi:hypothetical protein